MRKEKKDKKEKAKEIGRVAALFSKVKKAPPAKDDGKNKPAPIGSVFGHKLDPKGNVPLIVTDIVSYLEKTALNVEGIFRISGQVGKLQEIKQTYDAGSVLRIF